MEDNILIQSIVGLAGAKVFLQKLINPPLETLGDMLASEIMIFKFKRQVTLLTKAEAYLKKKGIKTKKVALKMLVPLLEESSLEEDETLHDMWAKLLANFVREDSRVKNNLFIHILSQINIEEAEILEEIITYSLSRISHQERTTWNTTYFSYLEYKADKEIFFLIDNLLRLRLIHLPYGQKSSMPSLEVTELGYSFYEACQTP